MPVCVSVSDFIPGCLQRFLVCESEVRYVVSDVGLENGVMNKGTERLFVYGTLAPGRCNQHLLKGVPGSWEAGSVRGRRVQGMRGSARGFPGVVLDESADKVDGYLFSSRQLAWHWKRLDRFEGSGYQRRPVTVLLRNGKTVTAQIYALRDC